MKPGFIMSMGTLIVACLGYANGSLSIGETVILVYCGHIWGNKYSVSKKRPQHNPPQYTVFLKPGEWYLTTISSRMQIIPRSGEYFIHKDQYYKISQVIHGLKNHIYMIANELSNPLSEHPHEGFRNAAILTHALDTGILKLSRKEEVS